MQESTRLLAAHAAAIMGRIVMGRMSDLKTDYQIQMCLMCVADLTNEFSEDWQLLEAAWSVVRFAETHGYDKRFVYPKYKESIVMRLRKKLEAECE